MFYRNNSYATKTVYGIEFKPGDIKEVPGTINLPEFMAVAPPEKPVPKVTKSEPKKESVKKEPEKVTTKPKVEPKTETKEETVDGTDNNQ